MAGGVDGQRGTCSRRRPIRHTRSSQHRQGAHCRPASGHDSNLTMTRCSAHPSGLTVKLIHTHSERSLLGRRDSRRSHVWKRDGGPPRPGVHRAGPSGPVPEPGHERRRLPELPGALGRSERQRRGLGRAQHREAARDGSTVGPGGQGRQRQGQLRGVLGAHRRVEVTDGDGNDARVRVLQDARQIRRRCEPLSRTPRPRI